MIYKISFEKNNTKYLLKVDNDGFHFAKNHVNTSYTK